MPLNPIETARPHCPYCGEQLVCEIDTTLAHQEYIEDCQVCCSPIVFTVDIDHDAEQVEVQAGRDD